MDSQLKIPLPMWAKDTRYEKLYENDIWLSGDQYKHITIPFSQEQDDGGRFVKMQERRPSIRLNLPKLGATISSRKLFAGKHKPKITHDNEKLVESLEWLVTHAKVDWNFLDLSSRGQSGSGAIVVSIFEGQPFIQVYKGSECYPTFDDGGNLIKLDISYVLTGRDWLLLNNGVRKDCQGRDIEVLDKYWFIRRYDLNTIATMIPIPESDWNPVDSRFDDVMKAREITIVGELTREHKLGVIPAVWIRNLPNGNKIDGLSTFDGVFSNCVHLDQTLSQLGRGINYMASPQLMVKGRILNYEKAHGGVHIFGPAHMLQLPADRSDPGGSGQSGADAKMIEMSGDGIKVGMEMWVEKVKHWSLEMISLSRKDPNTLKGTMSGTAIELIDEDFNDLIQVLRVAYGDYAYLKLIVLLAKLLAEFGHEKFNGISEKELDDVKLEWPATYTPDPQETLWLCQAMAAAIDAGMTDHKEASQWIGVKLDTKFTPVEVPPAEIQAERDHEIAKAGIDVKAKAATDKGKKPSPSKGKAG